MNKGYAFGFLIVLLVLILGLYVAFTGFTSSREALRAQPTSPSSKNVGQVVQSPTPTVTAVLVIVPTPTPGEMIPPSVMVPTSTTEPPLSTQTPLPPPTELPPAQPSGTSVPPAQPPTPVPPPSFQFRLAGPAGADPSYSICCYIFGTVRDAAGNGLEGVQVQAFNEWNKLPPALTKGGSEAGQYNIPIGRDVVTWYVVLVDADGNQISTQVPISFDPNTANGYRVDWQRTY